MITKILSGAIAIKEGAELINRGETVAFPTETVYGLGANAYNSDAVAKIFIAKGRPSDNPLIVHLSTIEDIANIASYVPDKAYKLLEKFSPGPLTIILPKKPLIPDIVTAGLSNVGIRIPFSAVAREFIDKCGVPIAAPSANSSTRLSPTSAEAVMEDLQGKIPLIIDGGQSDVGIESTVLNLTTNIPSVLRPGVITLSMIKTILPDAINLANIDNQCASPLSPGVKYKHYSPLVEMVLAKSAGAALMLYNNYTSCGIEPVIICRTSNLNSYLGLNCIDIGNSSSEVAKNIFSALRIAEKKYGAIISESFTNDEIEQAVMNRLNKACSINNNTGGQ